MNEFYKRLLVEEEQLKEKIVKLRSFLNAANQNKRSTSVVIKRSKWPLILIKNPAP